jgi:hypothetical protein
LLIDDFRLPATSTAEVSNYRQSQIYIRRMQCIGGVAARGAGPALTALRGRVAKSFA